MWWKQDNSRDLFLVICEFLRLERNFISSGWESEIRLPSGQSWVSIQVFYYPISCSGSIMGCGLRTRGFSEMMLTQHMELIFDIWSKRLRQEKDILFECPESSDLDVSIASQRMVAGLGQKCWICPLRTIILSLFLSLLVSDWLVSNEYVCQTFLHLSSAHFRLRLCVLIKRCWKHR